MTINDACKTLLYISSVGAKVVMACCWVDESLANQHCITENERNWVYPASYQEEKGMLSFGFALNSMIMPSK